VTLSQGRVIFGEHESDNWCNGGGGGGVTLGVQSVVGKNDEVRIGLILKFLQYVYIQFFVLYIVYS
jgi:hypothetical protein